jgi:uncharacterized protein (DUF2062 family)
MWFQKYLPTREQLRNTRTLQFLSHVIFEPNLWHFNRHSVSFATLIGLFCCFLPIPFQMIPCALLVAWVRCNLPLALGFVWISNPITMPPMMYFCYRVGTTLLGQPSQVNNAEVSIEWLAEQVAVVWQPLLLGSLLTGLVLGIIGFVSVRLYWRWKVARNWSMRRLRKKLTSHS